MSSRDMTQWETSICETISTSENEEVIVRGQPLSELIGEVSFAEMMFLLIQGKRPTKAQARVLDALLVASMEHGIAPPFDDQPLHGFLWLTAPSRSGWWRHGIW